MNTSGKAMKWLICFSVVNLMLGCLLFKKLKSLMNIVHCQKQLECHQHILNVHYCKFGNLPISSSSNENNMLKISP